MTLDEIKQAIGVKPYFEEEAGVIYNCDCLTILPLIPEKSIDLVLTDPPYGINGGRGSRSKERNKSNYSAIFPDTREYIESNIIPAINECQRIAIGTIVTPGPVNLDLYPRAESFGCFYQPASMGIQHWGRCDSQPILYYGKYYRSGKYIDSCSFVLTESPPKLDHPCAKPMKAWQKIVKQFSDEGFIILDPFLGSGTTAVAAKQLGRKFIGIEISEKYCQIAVQRLQQGVLI